MAFLYKSFVSNVFDLSKVTLKSSHAFKFLNFYNVAAIIILAVVFMAFQPFYFKGEGVGGRMISLDILPLVMVHGIAMTLWVILFSAQTAFIAISKRKLHMKLGLGSIVLSIALVVSGFLVAIKSVRALPGLPFWGMEYRQFLLIMFMELILFAVFVVAGILMRKYPIRHKAMMLLATMNMVTGATVRIPSLYLIYGVTGLTGIFGPVFTLGTLFVIARTIMLRALDIWLTVGWVILVAIYAGVGVFITSSAGMHIARLVAPSLN